MAVLQDYYNTNDDDENYFETTEWVAQTFTANQAYTITSAKIKVKKDAGVDQNLAVEIWGVDGSSHPDPGNVILQTTIAYGDISTTAGWVEATFGAGSLLTNGTQYALVVYTADSGVGYYWRMDLSSPTYAGGAYENSVDSGANWTTTATRDYMFETYSADTFTGRPLLM